MAFFSKNELRKLLKDEKDPKKKIRDLIDEGHELEGFSQTAQKINSQNNPGFVQGLAQDVAKPFLKTGVTADRIIGGVKGFGKAGIQRALGDKEGASNTIQRLNRDIDPNRSSDFGYLGRVKPLQDIRDAAGTGLELGAGALPIGKAGSVLGGGIGRGVLRGAGLGAISGGLGSGGRSIAEADSLGQGLLNTGAGLAGGAVLGGALGGAVPLVRRLGSKSPTQRISGTVGEGILPEGSFGDRAVRGIGNIIEDKKIIRSQPKQIRNMVKQGFDLDSAQWVDGLSSKSKNIANEMVDVAKKSVKQRDFTNRVENVTGREVFGGYDFLVGKAKKAGQSIDDIFKKIPDDAISANSIYDDFLNLLGEVGVKVDDKGLPIFTNESLVDAPGDAAFLKRLIKKFPVDENGDVALTPQAMRAIRTTIRENFKQGITKQEVSSQLGRVVDGIDSRLKQELVDLAESNGLDYATPAKQYAEVRDFIDQTYKLMGKKWNDKYIDQGLKNLKMGEVMRRTLSNTSSNTVEYLTNLNNLLKQYGYTNLEYLQDVIELNNIINKLYGTTQKNTFKALTQEGVGEGIVSAAGDALTGSKLGAATKVVKSLGFKNIEEAQRAFEKAIRSIPKVKN